MSLLFLKNILLVILFTLFKLTITNVNLAQYAAKQNRAKDDLIIIEKRKRLLQSFLNRVKRHPILASEHIFHRFLETGVNWQEVLNTPPLSTLPKYPQFHANVATKGDPNSPNPTAPGALASLKKPDPKFVEAEQFTNKFSNVISGPISKSIVKLMKKSNDLSLDCAELGATYNGFSLTENDQLATSIETVGKAVDQTFLATGEMVNAIGGDVCEPIEEYVKYGDIIKKVIKFRHQHHLQVEYTADSLEGKRAYLLDLEAQEEESKKIAAALQKETESRDPYSDDESEYNEEELAANPNSQDLVPNAEVFEDQLAPSPRQQSRRESTSEPSTAPASTPAPAPAMPTPKRSTNILNIIGHTIQGLIDVNPEITRRNNISKTKETIIQLEEQLEQSTVDLKELSSAIQQDLDRFQTQKLEDFHEILSNFGKLHIAWCKKNLEAWQDAKNEINQIKVD